MNKGKDIILFAFYTSDGAFISKTTSCRYFSSDGKEDCVLYTLRRVDIIMTTTMIASNSDILYTYK